MVDFFTHTAHINLRPVDARCRICKPDDIAVVDVSLSLMLIDVCSEHVPYNTLDRICLFCFANAKKCIEL